MSDTFEIDVREMLGQRIAEAPTAHAWSEVERRAADPDRPAPPPERRNPAVVWLAIAAAVVLVVAGAVVVWRDDDGSVVIEEGPATTVAETTVPTTVAEGADEDDASIDEDALDEEPDVDESGLDEAVEGSVAGSGGFAPIEPGTWHVAATVTDASISPGELDEIAAQVETWPGVLDVEVAVDAAGWERLTGLASSLCDGVRTGPPCGPGVVLLLIDGQQEPTGRRLESEFAMVPLSAASAPVEFIEGYFAAAVEQASPAPLRFDPTGLGDEIALTGPSTDITEDDDCALPDCEVLDEVAVVVDVDGEDVRVGLALMERDSRLFLIGTGAGGGFTEIGHLLPGSGGWAGVIGETVSPLGGEPLDPAGRAGFILAGLPLDVAVVTAELSDGTTVWQRPLAGMAVLPDVPGSADSGNQNVVNTLTALDGDGNEILLIDAGTPDGVEVDPERTNVVSDLRVDPDRLAAAEALLGQLVDGATLTDEVGDLTITWSQASWDDGEGPNQDVLSWGIVSTQAGVLSFDLSGVVWRWSDNGRWEPLTDLADYEVLKLVEGGGRVVANARRQDDGSPTVLTTSDGANWTELDAPALVPDPPPDAPPADTKWTEGDEPAQLILDHPVGATSTSGLSIFGSPFEAGFVAVIDGDRIEEVYDVPWPPLASETDQNFFEVLDGLDGAPVVIRYHSFEDEGADDGWSVRTEAWRYLGDGQFAPPTQVPLSFRSARVDDTILRFDRTDYESGDQPTITAGTSEAMLLSTDNGTDWTVHSTLNAETRSGLVMQAGDFFWAYGLSTSSTLLRWGQFATIWMSTDAENWSPLDISTFEDGTHFKVVGDKIFAFVFGGDSGEYWVGTVEPAT